jgi:hypothetical protein
MSKDQDKISTSKRQSIDIEPSIFVAGPAEIVGICPLNYCGKNYCANGYSTKLTFKPGTADRD